MKRAMCFLLISIPIICTACGQKAIKVETIQSKVAFNKSESAKKLPMECIVILPGDFKNTMPLSEEDNRIWFWFFTEGFQTIFRNVMVAENVHELGRIPKAEVIIRPELRSWFLGEIPQSHLDQRLWHCKMDFTLHFYNMQGIEKEVLVVDKTGWGHDRLEAVSDAMGGFINKLRVILGKKNM